jgi:hypothetical protein
VGQPFKFSEEGGKVFVPLQGFKLCTLVGLNERIGDAEVSTDSVYKTLEVVKQS